MSERRKTYDAGQPSAEEVADWERIKLLIIDDLVDLYEGQGRITMDMETADVRWMIAKIKDLQMQVNQLADLLAVAAGVNPLMDEKAQDVLDGFMDSIKHPPKHPPGSRSMFDEEGE